jgi:hypothetical protein
MCAQGESAGDGAPLLFLTSLDSESGIVTLSATVSDGIG